MYFAIPPKGTNNQIIKTMKAIYRKCENCDGHGYFPVPPSQYSTLLPNYYSTYYIISEENKCHNCNGTGRLLWGYIEDEMSPKVNIDITKSWY